MFAATAIGLYGVTRLVGMVWNEASLCSCLTLMRKKPGGELLQGYGRPSRRRRQTFAATARGRNQRSGGARFSLEFAWGNWYALWNRWAAMCPEGDIPCFRPC